MYLVQLTYYYFNNHIIVSTTEEAMLNKDVVFTFVSMNQYGSLYTHHDVIILEKVVFIESSYLACFYCLFKKLHTDIKKTW